MAEYCCIPDFRKEFNDSECKNIDTLMHSPPNVPEKMVLMSGLPFDLIRYPEKLNIENLNNHRCIVHPHFAHLAGSWNKMNSKSGDIYYFKIQNIMPNKQAEKFEEKVIGSLINDLCVSAIATVLPTYLFARETVKQLTKKNNMILLDVSYIVGFNQGLIDHKTSEIVINQIRKTSEIRSYRTNFKSLKHENFSINMRRKIGAFIAKSHWFLCLDAILK